MIFGVIVVEGEEVCSGVGGCEVVVEDDGDDRGHLEDCGGCAEGSVVVFGPLVLMVVVLFNRVNCENGVAAKLGSVDEVRRGRVARTNARGSISACLQTGVKLEDWIRAPPAGPYGIDRYQG